MEASRFTVKPQEQVQNEDSRVEQERRIVSAIVEAAPDEVHKRARHADRLRRGMRGRRWQEGDDVRLSRAEGLLEQARRVEAGAAPYFARVAGTFTDTAGEQFSEDIRVSSFPMSDEWETDSSYVFVASVRAGIADLVRNPNARSFEVDGESGIRSTSGVVQVHNAVVEDIEIVDGRVVRAAPRYTTVWEDRVREQLRRVYESGDVGLSPMHELLDREQSTILSDRRTRIMVIEGAAGTGKTAVALHRVGIVDSGTTPVWYIVPTQALKAHISPALPALVNNPGRFHVMTPWDVMELVLGLKGSYTRGEEEKWLVEQAVKELDALLDAIRESYRAAEQSALTRLKTYLETAVTVLRNTMPGIEERLREYTVRVGERNVVVDIPTVISSMAEGVLSGTFVDRSRLLFSYLTDIASANPMAAAFLSKDGFESILQEIHVDWLEIYRRGLRNFYESHNRLVPSATPIGSVGVACLLHLAGELGYNTDNAPRLVVVDEAHSFGPLFYRALSTLTDSSTFFTLAGDLQQRVSGVGVLASWDQAVEALRFNDASAHSSYRSIVLNKVYRLPPRIFAAARAVLGAGESNSEHVGYHPDEGSVDVLEARSAKAQMELVADVVAEVWRNRQYGVIIIAPNIEKAKSYASAWPAIVDKHVELKGTESAADVQVLDGWTSYRGGLAFASVEGIAGIEANVVIVTDATSEYYPDSPLAARRLHTAMSRARRKLVIIGIRAPEKSVLYAQVDTLHLEAIQKAVKQVKEKAERRTRQLEIELSRLRTAFGRGRNAEADDDRIARLEQSIDGLGQFTNQPLDYVDRRVGGKGLQLRYAGAAGDYIRELERELDRLKQVVLKQGERLRNAKEARPSLLLSRIAMENAGERKTGLDEPNG